jgi:hypothetical protein
VGLGLLAWALTPAAAGATPAINSAGKASQQRQEETEQEGERGQSPLQGDCSREFSSFSTQDHHLHLCRPAANYFDKSYFSTET